MSTCGQPCRHTAIVVVRDAMYGFQNLLCLRHAMLAATRSEQDDLVPIRLSWIACLHCHGEGRLPTGIRCPHCEATFRKLLDDAARNPLYTGAPKR